MRAALAPLLVAIVACEPAAQPAVVRAPAPPVCPLGGCDAPRAAASAPPFAEDLARVCDESSPAACTERGLELWGRSGAGASAVVLPYFERACSFGDARGCMLAGRLRPDGDATLARACDLGEPVACDAIARKVEPSAEERRRAYTTRTARVDRFERVSLESSCWRGGGSACFTVGLYAERGIRGFARDLALAARAYAYGCNAGEIVSCNNLANAVYYGDGVAQDFARAARLYQKACAGGEPVGCANVGFIAEYGDGVPLDTKRAGEMYRVGCSGGSAYSCLHARMLDAYARGVPHEPAKAMAAWQRACDDGDGAACAYLAIMHEDGKGTPRDEDRAGALMRRACDRKDAHACAWVREQTVR